MALNEVEMKDIVLQEQFSLIFNEVNYEIEVDVGSKKIKKKIIDNISAYCKSSELTAIMGPSGAGTIIYHNFRKIFFIILY